MQKVLSFLIKQLEAGLKKNKTKGSVEDLRNAVRAVKQTWFADVQKGNDE